MKPIAVALFVLGVSLARNAPAADAVAVQSGTLAAAPDSSSAVRVFRGIPYAEPPVGDLRWKAPQPVRGWPGVRPADKFAARCMQRAVFADMEFRSNGMSEDCLYLNVWTPARSEKERLPVLVYFYGGGYRAGDGSELRYDGASMAGKGIVALTVNYRLGVFGFLAHPELSREAPYHASGNYGLLDQNAALRWVQRNIAAFGGDPKRVTIAGESAGSISVSAHVASPLSKDLIAGAIMESGSLVGSMTPRPLAEAEQEGVKFAAGTGAASIAALRAMSAEKLLELTAGPETPRFGPTSDGYLLPKEVPAILDAGEQAHVPLLGGSNSEEQSARGLLKEDEPTPENYARAVRGLYGERAEEVLRLYPGSTAEEVLDSAMALAGDRFIGFSTWRFMEGHRKTAGKPVYRYYYAHPRPKFLGGYPPPPPPRGAAHSAEIEYALGNLATNTHFEWGAADHKLSGLMQGYFANFIKTGNPNGPGLAAWPAYDGHDGFLIMHLDAEPRAEPEASRARYLFLDPFYVKPRADHARASSTALLVLEKGARTLAIVDPDRLEIVGRVDAGEDPHEVVASEDGSFAYITNYGASSTPGQTLTVVDLAAKRTLPAVSLGALRAPHGIALAGGQVYFTAEGSKAIARYDPATRQVDWVLGIGQNRTHMLVASRTLDRIFTSNVNSDTVTILDRAKGGDVSGWTMTQIPVGKGPEGFDVSPDGKELWAANSHDGTVSIVDVAARTVAQTLTLNTKFANRLKFTPDGKRVLVSDLGTGDLLVLDAESRRELKRINLGHGVAGILVSGDGSRAYVAVSPDDAVAVVDLETLSVTGRLATGKGPDGMAWASSRR